MPIGQTDVKRERRNAVELVALILFLSVVLGAVTAPTGAHRAKATALRSERLPMSEPALAD